MSRRWLLSLLCLASPVVFVQLATANSALRVNESATRFLIQDQTIVVMEIVNPESQNLSVQLKLELLDPKDNEVIRNRGGGTTNIYNQALALGHLSANSTRLLPRSTIDFVTSSVNSELPVRSGCLNVRRRT